MCGGMCEDVCVCVCVRVCVCVWKGSDRQRGGVQTGWVSSLTEINVLTLTYDMCTM